MKMRIKEKSINASEFSISRAKLLASSLTKVISPVHIKNKTDWL